MSKISNLIEFLGKEFSIKVASLNYIFNCLQSFDEALILDMRADYLFFSAHITNSINLPSNCLSISDLIPFNSENIIQKFINGNREKSLFVRRKRLPIIIICYDTDLEELLNKPLEILNHVESCQMCIKKDQKHLDFISLRNSFLICKAFKDEKIREMVIVGSGGQLLINHYPFLFLYNCKILYEFPMKNVYPSEIFQRKFYLGDCDQATDINVINNLKITHILNATKDIPNAFENLGIKYLRVAIDDLDNCFINSSFPLVYLFMKNCLFLNNLEDNKRSKKMNFYFQKKIAFLPEEIQSNVTKIKTIKFEKDKSKKLKKCPNFIGAKELISSNPEMISSIFSSKVENHPNGHVLLVHCRKGMSRSATLVLMFIMRNFRVTLESALSYIKERREIVDPNSGFIKQLEDFEKTNYSLLKNLESDLKKKKFTS